MNVFTIQVWNAKNTLKFHLLKYWNITGAIIGGGSPPAPPPRPAPQQGGGGGGGYNVAPPSGGGGGGYGGGSELMTIMNPESNSELNLLWKELNWERFQFNRFYSKNRNFNSVCISFYLLLGIFEISGYWGI